MDNRERVVDLTRGCVTEADIGRARERDLFEAEYCWRPHLRKINQSFQAEGRRVPHIHWKWALKEARINHPVYAMWRRDDLLGPLNVEALLQVETNPIHLSRLPDQQHLNVLYLDHLEVCPNNIREYAATLGESQELAGCGEAMLRFAIRLSIELEWHGRIALHSIKSAESFYLSIGMTPVRRDLDHQDMMYFEFSAEAALEFIARTNQELDEL